MSGRRILFYFAWSRPAEVQAPLEDICDRFPAVFELRRVLYPRLEALADPSRFSQGIDGFLDHVQRPNFLAFLAQAAEETGAPVIDVERVDAAGEHSPLTDGLLDGVDTVILMSYDSLMTGQLPSRAEVDAIRRFLADPDHLLWVCVHHDIGETEAEQTAAYYHHGDRAIPPRQGFGGFARALLAALGTPVVNRYGLKPAARFDGTPQPIEKDTGRDRLGLLDGVDTFNLHAHLPHLERVEEGMHSLDVLARQHIDTASPPHPFVQRGNVAFDALLQSRAEIFPGTLLVSDATLWSSTAGGVSSLRRLWSNVVTRVRR